MSKKSRFNEYREAMFSEKPATATERREYLKRWGANKIAAQRDRLTERATYCAKHFASAACARCAGRPARRMTGLTRTSLGCATSGRN